MNIFLEPTTKFAWEFISYRKIQDCQRGSKVPKRQNLTSQITFWLRIWFPFIRFGQNSAWAYCLTLQTSPRKHLSQNLRWPPGSKVQNRPKFDPTNHFLAQHFTLYRQMSNIAPPLHKNHQVFTPIQKIKTPNPFDKLNSNMFLDHQCTFPTVSYFHFWDLQELFTFFYLEELPFVIYVFGILVSSDIVYTFK